MTYHRPLKAHPTRLKAVRFAGDIDVTAHGPRPPRDFHETTFYPLSEVTELRQLAFARGTLNLLKIITDEHGRIVITPERVEKLREFERLAYADIARSRRARR